MIVTSSSAPAIGPLSSKQVEKFRRQGYLVVPSLYTAKEMRQVRGWIDEMQALPERRGGPWMYFEVNADGKRLLNRTERVLQFHQGLQELALSDRMRGSCSQLFGEQAVLFKDKINFKLPGGGGFDAHQDVQAGWSRYGSLHITMLLTIDRSTRENGCLEMASGLHDRGLIGSEWKPLDEQDLKDVAFEVIEAEPGDAVFFDSYAPHRSGPNLTAESRRVLYITYGKESDGNQLEQYYADKFNSYPPDIEREVGREYKYRV